MIPSLKGYVHAVVESALADAALSRMASDLDSFNQLILTNPVLFGVITDSGISSLIRKNILSDLLTSRIDEYALRVIRRAVVEGHGDDLPAAFGEMVEMVRWIDEVSSKDTSGEQATGSSGISYSHLEVVMSRVAAEEEEKLSRSAARNYIGGYCRAVLDRVEDAGTLATVQEEVLALSRLFDGGTLPSFTLIDRSIPLIARRRAMFELLDRKVNPATVKIVVHSLSSRPRDMATTLAWLADLVSGIRGWRIGKVRSAKPLTDDELGMLTGILGDVAGCPVDVQVDIDSSLLGGVVVSIGDLVVDSSARRYLEALGSPLLGRDLAHQAVSAGMVNRGAA